MRLTLKEKQMIEMSLDYTVYQMNKEPYMDYEFKQKRIEPFQELRAKFQLERKLKKQALKNKGTNK